jgi:hypothetical protein
MTACATCGSDPCANPSFCRVCRDADRKARPEDPRILRARRLLADDVSYERAWAELNDSRNRPTPKTTIETVIHAVRERGLAALKESTNLERRCDATAKAEINERIEKLGLES